MDTSFRCRFYDSRKAIFTLMTDASQHQASHMPHDSAKFRTVPQDAASFGAIPKDSELFGRIPHGADAFGNMPNLAERTASHTLTVRDVVRMFELAGVARSERSIVNWCQPNQHGVARLGCYLDPNERRYFITLESVERAIKEEHAKATREKPASVPAGTTPNFTAASHSSGDEHADSASLELELRDLQITNRAKDMVISKLDAQLQADRKEFVEKLTQFSRKVGELETTIKQLAAPNGPLSVESNRDTSGPSPEGSAILSPDGDRDRLPGLADPPNTTK